MQEKARLIEQLDRARAEMQALLPEVDRQMEIYPGWTIKHVLAHITGWDEVTIVSLRAHAGGDEPGASVTEGIDVYNAQAVATREALSYEQIVKEWELARDELKAALREMPPSKFDETLLFPWGPAGSIAQIVAIFVEHEEAHAREIRELLARRDAN